MVNTVFHQEENKFSFTHRTGWSWLDGGVVCWSGSVVVVI
jgi:hypothetical protein